MSLVNIFHALGHNYGEPHSPVQIAAINLGYQVFCLRKVEERAYAQSAAGDI